MIDWTEVNELPEGAPLGMRMIRADLSDGATLVAGLIPTPTQLVGQHVYAIDVGFKNHNTRLVDSDACAECGAAAGEVCTEVCSFRGRWPTYAEVQSAVNELAPDRPGMAPLSFVLPVIQGVPEVSPASHSKLSLSQVHIAPHPGALKGSAHRGH